ncbi:UDP-3-O-(3-hydroxymyristoyl)glucosamine N-acyltransferase, partial [bacterium]|nr:UDP-3-O-(3-hydroxymyristoyl)glucosamine N-acyltransferase [bacterium]
MDLTLGELAASLGGELSDPTVSERRILAIRSLASAGENDVSFFRGDPRYLAQARETRAAAIVCDARIEGATRPLVLVEDAGLAVSFLLAAVRDLDNPPPPPGIHPKAHVDESAEIGPGVSIGPCAVIEAQAKVGARSRISAGAFVGRGTVLGEDCHLHPGAVVLHHCTLGARVILWSGAVIGRDGFGFLQREGRHLRIPQVGGVVLGDDVEVGSWSSVDRGAVDPTVVGEGVKIDSHCHVAHNCKVGEHSLLIGYARMGGSATLGKNVILAQEAAIGERRTAGDGAVLASGARALYKDVGAGEMVLGFHARPFTH